MTKQLESIERIYNEKIREGESESSALDIALRVHPHEPCVYCGQSSTGTCITCLGINEETSNGNN